MSNKVKIISVSMKEKQDLMMSLYVDGRLYENTLVLHEDYIMPRRIDPDAGKCVYAPCGICGHNVMKTSECLYRFRSSPFTLSFCSTCEFYILDWNSCNGGVGVKELLSPNYETMFVVQTKDAFIPEYTDNPEIINTALVKNNIKTQYFSDKNKNIKTSFIKKLLSILTCTA